MGRPPSKEFQVYGCRFLPPLKSLLNLAEELIDSQRVWSIKRSMSSPPVQRKERSATSAPPSTDTKPKKRICCACPETKKLRDECIVQHGEDACAKWIEAHKICLRSEGFNV
ncbi:hypothetical protein C5167_025610 [Papaver somniferum]|uniref:Cytochrome c oxidase copper chaperone n=1 Tax=Papaver somniferum TaxID=3469 RepID=A0A4Y7JUZ5_PAPSO|nr:hypothetical protein C5167_025610 [Papaver somniferum]